MDGYDRLRAATTALSTDQLRDCVESLVLGLYGQEDQNRKVVLTTDRDWSDDMVDGVIQVLADYGLHPDDLNIVMASLPRSAKRSLRVSRPSLRLINRPKRAQAVQA